MKLLIILIMRSTRFPADLNGPKNDLILHDQHMLPKCPSGSGAPHSMHFSRFIVLTFITLSFDTAVFAANCVYDQEFLRSVRPAVAVCREDIAGDVVLLFVYSLHRSCTSLPAQTAV